MINYINRIIDEAEERPLRFLGFFVFSFGGGAVLCALVLRLCGVALRPGGLQ